MATGLQTEIEQRAMRVLGFRAAHVVDMGDRFDLSIVGDKVENDDDGGINCIPKASILGSRPTLEGLHELLDRFEPENTRKGGEK